MLGFQILLIILVAAPVVAAACYMFWQIHDYIRKQNAKDMSKAAKSKKGKAGRRRR